MLTTLLRPVRLGILAVILAILPVAVFAAPFAAYVMDARTGETLYAQNADTRLYPASLTKMMTLYLTFQAIEQGKVSLDSVVTVTAHAANQPPSRLGLRAGQKIQLRYLIRAAAVKSANDAAAAIGDFLGGDEDGFAAKMNKMAGRLGMKNTTFRNANGLTREGHMSTAHDMAILGRHLIYDYPQYYGLFSRRTADAGIANVASTNRKFLDAYEGADGIKTGYTVPSGFNLVASAQRGNKRIIAAIFGGTSTAQRNSKMADLLDMGFARAPNSVRGNGVEPAVIVARASDLAGSEVTGGEVQDDGDEGEDKIAPAAAQIAAPQSSQRPVARPDAAPQDGASEALISSARPQPAPDLQQVADVSATAPDPRPKRQDPARAAFTQRAQPQPETVAMGAEPVFPPDTIEQGDADPKTPVFVQTTAPQPETLAMSKRNTTVLLAAMTPSVPDREQPREVVSRDASGGGKTWGISIGNFASKYAAQRALLQTALTEADTLGGMARRIDTRKTGFDAGFSGMSKGEAELVCARLTARASDCRVVQE